MTDCRKFLKSVGMPTTKVQSHGQGAVDSAVSTARRPRTLYCCISSSDGMAAWLDLSALLPAGLTRLLLQQRPCWGCASCGEVQQSHRLAAAALCA